MKAIFFGLVLMAGLGSAGQRPVDHKAGGQLSDSVRRVIDSSIVLLRTHALHRDRPDWGYVRERAYELAGQVDRWEDLGPAISWLFEAVGDRQGGVMVKGTMFGWKGLEPLYLSEPLKQELSKGGSIVRRLLPGGVGYLRIPGMVVDSAGYDLAVRSLSDSLRALEVEGARKFIIDLRVNAGGMKAPVMEGLTPLLSGRAPVVVLTGHGTSGAGECVAIAFKGRKHTWFIGEPTAGNAIGKVGYPIVPGQVEIFIAETMPMDRSGRRYSRNLIPDEWVPGGDDLLDHKKDKKVQAAIRRLN